MRFLHLEKRLLALGPLELFLVGKFRLALEPPVAPDVHNANAFSAEHAADQEAAMTTGGVFLAAHHRHAICLDPFAKSFDTPFELGRLCQAIVEHTAVGIVELVSGRPPANDVSKKQVSELPRTQLVLEDFLVEVRGVAAIRAGANVHNHFNLMLLQQDQEGLQRMV